jgi:bla regulator protein BlaR1
MANYLLKSIICSGILIVVYHLFLEREKMHHFNRCYLLLAMVFSLIIPWLSLELKQNIIPVPVASAMPRMIKKMENTAFSNPILIAAQDDSPMDISKYITFISYLVSCLLLVRFARNIWSVLKLNNQCRVFQIPDAKLVLVPQDIVTYTFLNNIYLPEKCFVNGQIRDEILVHELAHVRQMHSFDILFIELVHAVMWFNPFLFFYKKAIRLNHEFLADQAVLNEYSDVKSYQLLLLDTILEKKKVSFTSNFNYSITKKRLAMMTRIKNLKRHYFKQFVVGLLAFVLTFTFSEKIYSQIETGALKVTQILPDIQPSSLNQTSVVHMAENGDLKRNTGPGITKFEVERFYDLIDKHTTYITNRSGRIDPLVRMDLQTREQVYALYSEMNGQQHLAVRDSGIIIYQSPVPVKQAPTRIQFENWKKPEIFGIWINGKHVPNSDLEKYKNTDIAAYDLSKLHGAALKGRTYKYQLDLTTNDHFDKTYQQRVNDRIFVDRISRPGKDSKDVGIRFRDEESEMQLHTIEEHTSNETMVLKYVNSHGKTALVAGSDSNGNLVLKKTE